MDRRSFLKRTSASLAAAVSIPTAFQGPDVVDRASEIDRLMRRLHEQRLFTGEILVARRGRVIYKDAFGLADRSTGRAYTTDTRSCLASLSKPITAVAIMMLAEQQRLGYNERLSTFVPGFTDLVGSATIRHLLAHTSGIPDYPELGVDHPGVTNAEILGALRKVQKPLFLPGQKYQYSNSGYVLLALIIEKLSGQSLPRFLDNRVFGPLKMNDTFVLTTADQKTVDVARGYDASGRADDFAGFATGESGVYSTVNDLLRFDQALYTETLVTQKTLAEAFTPADRITVIMLTNGGDTDRMAINDKIQHILAD